MASGFTPRIKPALVKAACNEITTKRVVELLNIKKANLFQWRSRGMPYVHCLALLLKYPELLTWKENNITNEEDLKTFIFNK